MNTLEKYNAIFIETFQVEESDLNFEFSSDNVEKWDSVCQLSLVIEYIFFNLQFLHNPSTIFHFGRFETT